MSVEKTPNDILAAVARIRDGAADDGEDITSSAVLDALRLEEGFGKLSIAQVKAAEKKLGVSESSVSILQSYTANEDEEEEDVPGFRRFGHEQKTCAANCIVRGAGLEEATVKQVSYFWIEARDGRKRKRTSGGDTFFVAVRGPSQSRARVTDNFDGTYLVVWKPHVSGTYSVAVSLFGELLPGAPFIVHATTSNPCASKCTVRGEALNLAVSRAAQTFDILFKDRLGQVARAVDVDVFVEPVAPNSPRNREKKSDTKAGDEPLAEESSFREKKPAKREKMERRGAVSSSAKSLGRKGSSTSRDVLSMPAARPLAEEEVAPTHEVLTNDVELDSKGDEKTRSRTIRVKVKEKPLIVRAGPEKDTEQIGLLLPGQIVTVIEERLLPESSEVRACIALDSIARAIDGLAPGGGSAGEHASTFHRTTGDVSPKLITTSELSPTGGMGGSSSAESPAAGSSAVASASPAPAAIATPASVKFTPLEVDVGDPGGEAVSVLAQASSPGATSRKQQFQDEGGPQIGWVTLVKSGKKLVSSRVKLGPGSRRQYMGQWARRKLNDRTEHQSGHLAKTIMQELTSDPSGVGFGFGGVEPGVLHAQGKLHEVHKVSYSIGLAGQYLLHVRLRQQAMAVKDSPFQLTVLPGPAHAKSTQLSTAPLRGMVGNGDDTGCTLILHAADRMGNLCSAGGAKVQILCDAKDMITNVDDNGDGTYRLKWNSKFSGVFKTRVVIDNLDTIGSPREFALTSSNPNLSKSELTGEGLKSAVAGKQSTIRIVFVDDYGNTAIPGPEFKFGMSLGKDKEKLNNAKPHDFQGEWEPGDTGVFEMHYIATVAGGCELHVWCDPNNEGARVAFPGSPYHVNVTPGKASPAVSVVGEWTKVQKEEKGDKNGKGADASELHASDTITLRPQIFDDFGNATQLPEGALRVVQKLPNDTENNLNCNIQSKGGLTTYDVRHDTAVAGTHLVHIYLFDTPIRGSPVSFTVLPDKPDPAMCKLIPPPEETLMVDNEYMCVIKTFDKFGNQCIRGGLTPQVRLQLNKQSVHDQTTLVPSNHMVSNPAEDQKNGEYFIRMNMQIPCVFKVNVNIDKNIPSAGGELPPITVTIINPDADKEKEGAAAPSDGKGRRKSMKLVQAVNEVTQGFGDAAERRDKDLLVVAAEAFADAAAAKDAGAAAAAASGDAIVSPNKDLFDKGGDPDSPGALKRKKSVRRNSIPGVGSPDSPDGQGPGKDRRPSTFPVPDA